jgi:hypothetical protein
MAVDGFFALLKILLGTPKGATPASPTPLLLDFLYLIIFIIS